ncbi:MAG TPA: helix-turn-helix domain-containing protein [Mycobacteriales bacterium]|nr:helix-turn-helix domain-containing protein [Mycobacteriales bacterium]
MPVRKSTAASTRRVERATGALATTAVRRMGEELAWFRDLAPEHRSWVGLVAQSGIAAFVQWQRAAAGTQLTGPVFGVAPRALARVITLQQTVELVQLVVDVVEEAVPDLAAAGEEAALREGVLRFSREVAFAAAQVYASAAEERGAWHARSRALLVEALVRGGDPDLLEARAAAMAWAPPAHLTVAVGAAPLGEPEQVLDEVELRCRAAGLESLAGLHGDRLLLLLGADAEPALSAPLVALFADGPVVVGPTVSTLAQVAGSARAALSGLRVVAAWRGAPCPVAADELLPERALDGDEEGRVALVDRVYRPLAADAAALETVSCYLDEGRSVEATARTTFLHANTVRYRLRKAAQLTGHDPLDARAAFVLQIALTLGRLANAPEA